MVGTASHSLEKNIAALRSYAARLTGNRPEADDLLNETIARYLAADGPQQTIEDEYAWLHVIMRNTWFNTLRVQKSLVPLTEECSNDMVSESAMNSAVVAREMCKAIASLPKKLQDVICAHVEDDGSPIRMGRRLGVSTVTVRTRLNTARRVLRSRLELNEAWA